MAYVALAPVPTAALHEMAERRWEALRVSRPDLAPAVALQRDLLGIVMQLSATLEARPRPRLSMPPKYVAAKLARGVPALSGEPVPLPLTVLAPALLTLCDALAAGGAGDAATHIHESLGSGTMEAGSLLTASFKRDQPAIRIGATHRGLAPDLVWLVAELAVSPFIYGLQRSLFDRTAQDALHDALVAFGHGYCPACGSWPAVAEVVGGHRTLRCSFCAAAWELPVYACIYCGEKDAAFLTAAPNEERKDRRVELCRTCGGYLKTIDLEALSPFPLLAISDIETTDLDVAAMEHGYGRPALKSFTTPRP